MPYHAPMGKMDDGLGGVWFWGGVWVDDYRGMRSQRVFDPLTERLTGGWPFNGSV